MGFEAGGEDIPTALVPVAAKPKRVKKAPPFKPGPLGHMPDILVPPEVLIPFGSRWKERNGRLSRTPPESSSQLAQVFDKAVATAFATMVGGVPVVDPVHDSLSPAVANSVELGAVLVIGGVRPQNFDVGYRPDGVRFAFDSKTLNDTESVRKNYQNMINDLATEATTVHTRFPYALVAFIVAIPRPCLFPAQSNALIGTLERLARREAVDDPDQLAEAIALVTWDPESGLIDPGVPSAASPLRLSQFSRRIEEIYLMRYKGLPPHAAIGDEAEDEQPGEA